MSSTVDQIRYALEQQEGLTEEVMRPLATAYADEVYQVNARLYEAVALLRKGLRSEAIQRASMKPNAIDGAANLDFPEVEAWHEFLRFLAIPVPPEVNQDAARELNEAIVDTQPLTELLNRHRRLAIAKAPLAWRIRVLRRIAQLDPVNPVWEDDLEEWESVRLKQIPGDLKTAISEGDAKSAASLRDELTNHAWRIEPESRLVKNVCTAVDQFLYDSQLARLREITPQLHDAFAQFDASQAVALRNQWREVQAVMKAPPPMELQDQVAPALAWLEGLDREAAVVQERAEAIGQLESALDRKQPVTDLQPIYLRASRFDEPIPIELEQRYRVAVAEHELLGRRKTQAVFASIIAVTLLAAGSIGFWQWKAQREQRLTTATTQMKTLLDSGKLTEAEQYLQRIETTQPEVAETAAMASLRSQLNGLQAQEASRATQFANYLEQSANDDPAKIDVSALSKAESLAVSEKEKAAVFQVRRKLSQWERELQAEHTKSALDQLDGYRAELKQIESGIASAENLKAIAILVGKVGQLSAMYPRRSSSADAQIQIVNSRALAIRDAMRKQSQSMQTRQDATNRVLNSSSLGALANNLRSFSRELPTAPMAAEFSKVAEEQPLWDQALETNQFASLLRASLIGGITPEETTTILEAYGKLTSRVAENPLLDSIPDIVEKLTSLQNREAVLDQVFHDLQQQTFADLVTIEAPSDNDPTTKVRYFLYDAHFNQLRSRLQRSGNIGVEVVVNESAAVERKGFVGPLTVISEPQETVKWLVNKKNDHRKKFLADWEGTFLQTAAELRTRPNLDGLIKESLLLSLLEGGAQGSDMMQQSLTDALKLLKQREQKRKDWFVAKPLESSLDPDVEKHVVPEMSRAYADRNAQWRGIQATSQREYRWVGCLLRNHSGSVMMQINEAPANIAGKLYVVRPAGSDPSKVEFSEVGNWMKDHAVLGSARDDLIAGRPLFFLATATSN